MFREERDRTDGANLRVLAQHFEECLGGLELPPEHAVGHGQLFRRIAVGLEDLGVGRHAARGSVNPEAMDGGKGAVDAGEVLDARCRVAEFC